ncbi:MAG: murein hydrolase activator EnvC family protein [Acidimicrobiales bacterium]
MLLVSGPAARPAAADDVNGQRKSNQDRQHQVQQQLNLAVAADAQVEAEVARLDGALRATQSQLDSAQQASVAADQEVSSARAHLDDTTRRASVAKIAVVRVAVDAYMHGGASVDIATFSGLRNVSELGLRQEYMRTVQGNRADAADALRAARIDQSHAASGLLRAQALARTRVGATKDQADDLTRTRAAQAAADAELQKRITGLRSESTTLAAHETQLEQLIAARIAPAPQAAPPPAAAAGSSGAPSPPLRNAPVPNRSGGFIWPVHGPVTSEFGPRYGGFHPGMDIAPPYGTPIHASAAGTVILAETYYGYGLFVLIDHGGGIVTGYAHQSQLAVTAGQQVSQGQVIGYEGSTGESTGPHVHFEVRVNNQAVNPRGYVGGNP